MSVLVFVEPGDELSLQALSVARSLGEVRAVSLDGPYAPAAWAAAIVEAVSRHAEVSAAEIVGLAPRAALEGFPASLEIRGFDPARQIIENHLD